VPINSKQRAVERPEVALQAEDFRLYRAQAVSFERQATHAVRADARAEFLELARLWGKLADETERAAMQKGPATLATRI
jgi:hypothetical protein